MIPLDERNKIVRRQLEGMAPLRAISLVKSFQLPEEEEYCIIQKEIRKRSVVQIAADLSYSPETVKQRRKDGLNKIYQTLYG